MTKYMLKVLPKYPRYPTIVSANLPHLEHVGKKPLSTGFLYSNRYETKLTNLNIGKIHHKHTLNLATDSSAWVYTQSFLATSWRAIAFVTVLTFGIYVILQTMAKKVRKDTCALSICTWFLKNQVWKIKFDEFNF